MWVYQANLNVTRCLLEQPERIPINMLVVTKLIGYHTPVDSYVLFLPATGSR